MHVYVAYIVMIYAYLLTQGFAENLFKLFDSDCSGAVSLQELVGGLGRLTVYDNVTINCVCLVHCMMLSYSSNITILASIITLFYVFIYTDIVEKIKFFIGLNGYLHRCQEKISYFNWTS